MTTVASLRPDQKGLTLVLKVTEAATVMERSRGKGAPSMKIAECLVGDHTGSILFIARNEQVDIATKGATITLTNARVEMNRTNMRLALDPTIGKVEAGGELSGAVNTANNMSLIEFELVQVGQA